MMTIARARTKADREARQRQVARSPAAAGVYSPGDLPMLRTSERGTFKRCRWKWWWEFNNLLKPRTDTPPLRFGSLIHAALAAYYVKGVRRGTHPSVTFKVLYEEELRAQAEFGFKVPDLEGD